MLNIFKKYIIIDFDKFKNEKIESLHTSGNRLYIGSSSGILYAYAISDINEESNKNKFKISLIQKKQLIKKNPIKQISVLREIGLVLVLFNSSISVYDFENLDFQYVLPQSTGAILFAASCNIENQGMSVASRIAVSTKKGRNLVFYEWKDTKFSITNFVQLTDKLRSMCFFTSELNFSFLNLNPFTSIALDCALHENTNIHSNEKFSHKAPLLLVCAMTSQYCIFDMSLSHPSSKIIPNVPIPLKSTSFLSNSYYHTISLKDGTALLIKDANSAFVNSEGNILVERSPVPWTISPNSVTYYYPYLVSADINGIQIRNIFTMSLTQFIPLSKATHLICGKYLFASSNNKIYGLYMESFDKQIDLLVKSNLLDESISLVEHLEPALLENRELIYRNLQIKKGKNLFKEKNYMESMKRFSLVSTSPTEVLSLFPPFISDSSYLHDNSDISSINSSSDVNSKDMNSNSISFSFTDSNNDLQNNDTTEKDKFHCLELIKEMHSIDDSDDHSEDFIKNSVQALLIFLIDTRRKLKKLRSVISIENDKEASTYKQLLSFYDVPNDSILVDTTLLKCYMLTNKSLIGPLVRINNFCNTTITEIFLLHTERYKNLLDFYYGKSMHSQALELLKKLHFGDASKELQNTKLTVQYLQRLDATDINLILKYSKWVLEADIKNAYDIFFIDTCEAESLPREKVANFLKSFSEELEIEYFKHIINDLGDLTPTYHTNLIRSYISLEIKQKDTSKKNEILSELLNFLQTSQQYDPEEIISLIPSSDTHFYQIKVFLYFKMNLYERGIRLLIFKMKDYRKAYDYCIDFSKQSAENDIDIFEIFLKVLYQVPDTKENKKLSKIYKLLASQGPTISLEKVLDILPESTPISCISKYLTSNLRNLYDNDNRELLLNSLTKEELLKTEETLLNIKDKFYNISNTNVCQVCFKRLGQSVISIFPDGSIVHYGCAVTKNRFRLLDEN